MVKRKENTATSPEQYLMADGLDELFGVERQEHGKQNKHSIITGNIVSNFSFSEHCTTDLT